MSPTLSPRREQDKPKLLDQVRDTIRRKDYSIRADLRLNLTVFPVTRQRYCTSSLYTGSNDSITDVFFTHAAFPLVAAKRKFSSHSSTSSSSADGKTLAATNSS